MLSRLKRFIDTCILTTFALFYKSAVSYESQADHMGVKHNDWQTPITAYGSCNPDWQAGIASLSFVGNIDFDRKDWAESRQAVEEVMNWILRDLRRQSPQYKGLRIDSFIRQGSSRDGLKVLKADEFDAMLEFHIEGLENRVEQTLICVASGKTISGFCYLQIHGKTMEMLQKSCPELYKANVFQMIEGQIFFSSKRIHERVFASMVDKAIQNLSITIQDTNTIYRNAETFRITRKMNPPAINVNIEFKFSGRPSKVIDLDLVPAYRLRLDTTTKYEGSPLNCEIHAVCKWTDGEDLNQDLIWSAKSTRYETHVLDTARNNQRKLYILTALRIIKTYFVKTKQTAKAAGNPPPQIVTVLRSYHLKQIAFYMIYYLCHKYTHFKLYSAQDALVYFFDLLKKVLETKRLPHFFFTKSVAQDMLPGYPETNWNQLRYNLFRKISSEALARAKQSLDVNLIPGLGFSVGGSGGSDYERTTAIQDFTDEISGDDYF